MELIIKIKDKEDIIASLTRELRFSYGDVVYHMSENFGKGVILNWKLNGKTSLLKYKVNFEKKKRIRWYENAKLDTKERLWNLVQK